VAKSLTNKGDSAMWNIDLRVLMRLLVAGVGAASIMLMTSGCFYETATTITTP
jgi:hypothetical protein